MEKKDRAGNRKTRDQRKQFKVPELGYYLIVTDTEATERCFFTGLHQALPENVRNKLVIKVVETKTSTMIDKCLELTAYNAQYRILWIVFDRDQVQGFDDIIAEAAGKGIQVGWSNPCFEIWLLLHAKDQKTAITTENLIKELKKCASVWKNYTKSDFTETQQTFLKGNTDIAVKRAKGLKELQNPSTSIYKLIDLLKGGESKTNLTKK